jgi:uncharacterized protein (DUF2141 family)
VLPQRLPGWLTTGWAVLLLTISCVPAPPAAFAPGAGTLVVNVEGLRSDRGTAIVSVFAGPQGFPDEIAASVRTEYLAIAAGRAVATFADLPYGEYAVSVLHDEDGDGRMATGLFGLPREGFGFSGTPDYRFGHPGFAEVSLVLIGAQRELTIGMRYETGRRQHQDEGRAGNLGRPQE